MLFGFVLPGYEFDADLEAMELSVDEATRNSMNEDDAGAASAEV
jgi:hypothetical protein